ncbi:multidrug ABC transporter ATP-binding protein [Haladaptatus sp. W1]|uniref:ABC transporter ATP-binding protein n=1 Tax=unclassified Haladaptatus TaxID=2622732 RepID=UPI000849E0ED|nr:MULTISPECIES: ABC transporter ATP-binding protein [unclassified Haladaptatus]ODR81537.1 multidrug ABC transporter ATP-binding protein [Haladaptatus sp. W1]GKZ15063.1 multidrug ABC transporter ATP-binding protein [Haladaptatus sp. T7]
MRPAIETDGLTKRFDDTTVVSNLELTVPSESVYGFLGPNGAGKTTTMRMLTTLTPPTSGTARVAGHSIADRDAVVPHIGYMPEEPPLYDELTAREQLQYIAGLRNVEADDRIETLLRRFDLLDDADERVGTYSKGMKQKTALIQTVLHEPDVVFLDEPTSGLDPRAARTVRELISELTADGMTVFLSTHILPVVEELADTVGVLYDGSLVAEDSPERLTHRAEKEQTLEDVFLDVTSEEPAAAPVER